MRSRGLSDHFILQLDEGRLQPLLARVHADDTLCLEIRDSCINIYYRGGSLAKVAEDQPGHFTISMDYNYFGKRRKDILRDLPKTLPDAGASEKWIEAFPQLKETMDLHFGANPGEEREYKQLVVRDNNGRYGSTASDYFILDMEYGDSTLGAQFDFVAAHWQSKASVRKDPTRPRLTLIEMKVGDGAIGSVDRNGAMTKPGLSKHLTDIEAFCRDEDDGAPSKRLQHLREEMLVVAKQKHALKLLPTKHAISAFSEQKPLFLFLLANHDPDSMKLRHEIERLPQAPSVDVRFAVGTFMGYGLFDQGVLPIEALKSRHSDAIPVA